MNVAELRQRRDALLTALAAPEKSVADGTNSAEYRGVGELRAALAELDRQIREADGRPPVTTVRFSCSKGL
ncbi:phage head-tail joining protein [Caenispirillum bisanense]|uniref:phage head-tail joining protein n=1 Tax=Caenispirillum bisanense TaxID=414052 RepID=UPI0031D349B7